MGAEQELEVSSSPPLWSKTAKISLQSFEMPSAVYALTVLLIHSHLPSTHRSKGNSFRDPHITLG